MIFEETYLKDVYVIKLEPYYDERGYFVRLFCDEEFKAISFNKNFVQINHSSNKHQYTFRGFHYQVPPFSETKLIRCVSGRLIDYIIDLRKNSPTYLQSYSVELSEENSKMILIPDGFAHGYLTLENNTSLIYFHTEFFKPGYYDGFRYSDPQLEIKLPVAPKVISTRDSTWPLMRKRAFPGLELNYDTLSDVVST